jgi:hypothetical protein
VSDVGYEPRRVRATPVRNLGEATPVYALGPIDRKKPAGEKTHGEIDKTLTERLAESRDAATITTRCAVDGCAWSHTGTAGESREHAARHRAAAHPELVGRRTHRQGGVRMKKRGEVIDQAVVEESRRRRQERDDAARLETIERGRRARGELLEEVDAATRAVPVGASISSSSDDVALDGLAAEQPGDSGSFAASTTTNGRAQMRRWTRDTMIEELQRVSRELGHTPTAAELTKRKLGSLLAKKFLKLHGFESYRDLCRAAGLQPNAPGTKTSTARRVPQASPTPSPAPEPQPEPPAAEKSLVEIATELEQARAEFQAATDRYHAALDAFRAHQVVRDIANHEGIAA